MDNKLWIKSPVMVLLLGVITCGIYLLFWMYAVRNELKIYLEDPTINPGLELFLVIICAPYMIYWYYKVSKDVARAQTKAGLMPTDVSLAYMLLAIFGLGIVADMMIQEHLNDVWNAQS